MIENFLLKTLGISFSIATIGVIIVMAIVAITTVFDKKLPKWVHTSFKLCAYTLVVDMLIMISLTCNMLYDYYINGSLT